MKNILILGLLMLLGCNERPGPITHADVERWLAAWISRLYSNSWGCPVTESRKL